MGAIIKMKETIIMKKVAVLSFVLACATAFSIAGCNMVDKASSTVDSGNTASGESTAQQIEKNELGISMELTGEYTDCVVTDLTKEELDTLLAGAHGGFKITKEVAGENAVLANVILTKNNTLTKPEVRSQFPFQFNGNIYSIVASLPLSATSGETYETINSLQANIISTQLITLFLDETVLPDGTGEAISIYETDNTEEEADDSESAGSSELASDEAVSGEEADNENSEDAVVSDESEVIEGDTESEISSATENTNTGEIVAG